MHANYPQSTLKFCIPTFYLSLYSNVANFGCKLNTANRTRLEMSRILNVRLLHMTLIVPLYTLLYELSSKSEEESRKCSWIAPPHLGQNGYFIFAEIFVYVKYVKKVADIPPPPSPYGNFPVYWQWLQSSVILIEITFFIFFALNSLKVGFYEYWYMRSESLGFNPNYWSYGWVHYRYL